ncbi:interleukin-6 receptor subunit beta-like [Mercenaria mercenaria]|uniref:interleukin-6 receptor subunit beta-like n=1 Tax=Mercenaria mercenaria TaxID=6596 RepID=UPI00234E66C3|nr:interleukin-6 receptor subunit beta-like [Mercenaria mercenaria]
MLTSKTTEVEDRVLMLHFYIALCCTLSLCVCAQEFNITPLDPAVCAGADVTFRCSSAADKMSQLKQIQPIILREVEGDTDLKLINQHTSELTLYNVTNKDDKLLVCCSLVHGDCDILLASTLNVYPLPEKVHNFSCLVENYNSMNCSWNYGKIYGPFKEPEVALQWRMQNDSSWKECSNLNTRYGYCYWDTSHFIMKKMQIRLTLTQPCEVSVVSDFQIDTSKIVKPDPVVALSSKVLNSTCIQIVWSNTVNIYRKEHRVIVSSKWRDNRELRINSTADTENLSQRRTFCNLHPHTYYTFTVSTQPTGQQAGFFSDPKAIVALTYSDKPSTSPKVTKGGYHWHRMECEGNSNIRRVCIFWKPLKEEDKNGDIKGLHVTFTAVQRNGPTFQEDWPGDLTYGCVNGLLCNTAYTFTIKAENINGTSEQGSTLYISSANSGIPQPTFIVESNNENQLYVSLANVERINADGFVVAWCRNHNGGCKSDHEVQWKRFPWNTREVVIQIDPTKSPQDFLYGVSVLTEQGSSGVEWQDCVYMKNIKPKREPRNVAVSAGQEDNSLVVTWDKLTCKSDEPYIAMYNVRYNKLGDEYRKSQTVTASGEARLVMEDLEEDQIYEVTVRGITKDGGFGPDSEPRTGIPLNKSLKTGTIVGISVTAFLFVVLSGVGCYCVISGCTKKAKYAINEAAKITIPGLNNNDVNTPSEGTSVDCDPSYILAARFYMFACSFLKAAVLPGLVSTSSKLR